MKYIITAVVARIHSGVLSLSKEQAELRMHNLNSLGKGMYEVINPVEFKSGEEIGFDGELPKQFADLVEAEAGKKAKPAKAKADLVEAEAGSETAAE